MRKTFDTFDYVKDLGKDLVHEFEKAGKTTHPHSVGGGREKSAIDKLKDILPEGIGVGSGFVIDSNGSVSSQCDIILYEKNLALKFNSNDSANCYYNCESVIAVGEVKSDLTKKELLDSLAKMKKIKNLTRYCSNTRNFRGYLSTLGMIGTESEKYDPLNKNKDQIFTFLICNTFKIKENTIVSNIKSTQYQLYEYINCIISIEGKLLGYYKKEENSNNYSKSIGAINAEVIGISNIDNPFGQLLDLIFWIIYSGRTVDYNPKIYILERGIFNASFFPL